MKDMRLSGANRGMPAALKAVVGNPKIDVHVHVDNALLGDGDTSALPKAVMISQKVDTNVALNSSIDTITNTLARRLQQTFENRPRVMR